jgi:hypothetical protein
VKYRLATTQKMSRLACRTQHGQEQRRRAQQNTHPPRAEHAHGRHAGLCGDAPGVPVFSSTILALMFLHVRIKGFHCCGQNEGRNVRLVVLYLHDGCEGVSRSSTCNEFDHAIRNIAIDQSMSPSKTNFKTCIPCIYTVVSQTRAGHHGVSRCAARHYFVCALAFVRRTVHTCTASEDAMALHIPF